MNITIRVASVLTIYFSLTLNGFAQDAMRQPSDALEAATLIMNLQRNKNVCEGFVLLAKSDKVHKRDMNVGMMLYSDAMTEYNSLIMFLSTAVGLGEELDFSKSQVEALERANEKAFAFRSWYVEPLLPETQSRSADGVKSSPAIAGAILDIGVEIVKAAINHFAQKQIDENRMKEQRRIVIREGLSQCRWDRWDKIGSDPQVEPSMTQTYVPRHRRFRFR